MAGTPTVSTAPVGLTLEELKASARIDLGYPVIQVELDIKVEGNLKGEMWEKIAKDTLLMYSRYKTRLVPGVTHVSSAYKKYLLPKGVTGIIRWGLQNTIPQFQDIEFSILYRSPQTYLYDVQDLAWWQSHLHMVSRVFGFEPEVQFQILNDGTDLVPNWNPYLFINQVPQGISYICFLASMIHDWRSIPQIDEDLIRKLFAAKAKQVCGTIRRKYSGVPAPGGQGTIQLDGEALKAEGKLEEDEVRHQLLTSQDKILVPHWG